MPKVTVTDAKGLVQSKGSGLAVASAATFTGNLNAAAGVTLGTQSLSGPGVCSVVTPITLLTSTAGTEAVTLAAGTAVGQVKYVIHDVDGGSSVLTVTSPLSVAGAVNTLTFTTVGETATFVWTGTGWALVGRAGFANANATSVADYPAITSV